VHLGLDRVYPQLAHHNFFYSGNLHQHFRRVFRDRKLPDDPTIYLVASTRSDPSRAPVSCDNIKILPHIPPIYPNIPFSREDYISLKEICLDKLERLGLTDLRKHIIVEDFWTPFDIEARYASNRGSIYGVVAVFYCRRVSPLPEHPYSRRLTIRDSSAIAETTLRSRLQSEAPISAICSSSVEASTRERGCQWLR